MSTTATPTSATRAATADAEVLATADPSDPDSLADHLRRHGVDGWSDVRLSHAAGTVLAAPKVDAADSYVLHAPLELHARVGLLRHVAPDRRAAARRWIAWLAATYERAGAAVAAPAPSPDGTATELAGRLVAAIEAGDLDDVDAVTSALANVVTPGELPSLLGDAIVPYLSAAGHTAIGLHLFPRTAGGGEVPLSVLRGTMREVARWPMARLEWAPQLAPAQGGDRTDSLTAALLDTPELPRPDPAFIWPTMSLAETSGGVADVLGKVFAGPIDVASVRRQLLRLAAQSMLQDDPSQAPYGWSHCLTMPQGALAVADASSDGRIAAAVAATYVVGFRATLGRAAIDPNFVPDPTPLPLGEAIGTDPALAAASAWHEPDRAAVRTELASRASDQEDAHLAKYVLACFDAADADRPATPLYLAAAAYLTSWWTPR